ncbi:MAG: nodulation protein NfeD [Candidatus Thermoplasmatota archaeon]|nr:nodulation protein NfeD [Candidatus Thermoplasmatota archaeon]MBS3790460.1 nodulation protein NfeD [Candidatus Thermoplasmatota archaeon]
MTKSKSINYIRSFPTSKNKLFRNIAVIIIIITIVFTSFQVIATAQENTVYSITIDGEIDGGTAHYVERAISKAEEEGSPLIIKIDTPGGLLNPTKDIVTEIQNTDITVVTWITPRGAWGYSAGAFITLAGDIALMDHETSIGSAEPRPADNKTVNAMTEYIATIADGQNRSVSEARKFVTQNLNINATEAENRNLIDGSAKDENEVLQELSMEDAVIEEIEKGFTAQLLSLLTNPTVAFLLLLLGILGLVTEITTGGVGVPGIGGGIALILAFIGLMILELSTVGILLIILGVVLLTAEYFEPGFGVFGIGGAIALFLGILFVGEEPYFEISSEILMGLVAVIIGISFFVIWAVRKSQKREVETGMEKMKGVEGKVTKSLDKDGVVKVRGERWAATSKDNIEEGENIVVKDIVEKDGQTTLLVERVGEK